MPTTAEAYDALDHLVGAALRGKAAARTAGIEWLSRRDSSEWLRLDSMARGYHWSPVLRTPKTWSNADLAEPSGLAAAVAAMHPDGRLRERATRALAGGSGAVSTAALALRCLDHVAQVRGIAIPALLERTSPADSEKGLAILVAAGGRPIGRSALAATPNDWSTRTGLPRFPASVTTTNARPVAGHTNGSSRPDTWPPQTLF